ncbi:hypothetical protein [Actinocrispum sp. NPDC049592]|uniref:hypothetical protein n=1 Tax=Actinocrispum sp. NPDC049592 TaxID=3154835 RepID=UPI00343C1F6D
MPIRRPTPTTPSRRTILPGGVAAAGLTALDGAPASAAPGKLTDPSALGVASGDPYPRQCDPVDPARPGPLRRNGLGGMPGRPIPVQWEIATDERFRHVVRRGEDRAGLGTVRNGVVLTGDVHRHWAAEIKTAASFVVEDRKPALNPV